MAGARAKGLGADVLVLGLFLVPKSRGWKLDSEILLTQKRSRQVSSRSGSFVVLLSCRSAPSLTWLSPRPYKIYFDALYLPPNDPRSPMGSPHCVACLQER